MKSHCKIIALLLLAWSILGVASEKEAPKLTISEPSGNMIIYRKKINSEWHELFFLSNNSQVFPLFLTANTGSLAFEESTEHDFSKNKKYLTIHKIERGTLSTENGEDEQMERSYCSFIDMRSGCIVKESTGEFCGGTWGNENGDWVIDGESVAIDIREDQSRQKLEIDDYFKSFSTRDNHLRYLTQQ